MSTTSKLYGTVHFAIKVWAKLVKNKSPENVRIDLNLIKQALTSSIFLAAAFSMSSL